MKFELRQPPELQPHFQGTIGTKLHLFLFVCLFYSKEDP